MQLGCKCFVAATTELGLAPRLLHIRLRRILTCNGPPAALVVMLRIDAVAAAFGWEA
jgi:hypothetical protein